MNSSFGIGSRGSLRRIGGEGGPRRRAVMGVAAVLATFLATAVVHRATQGDGAPTALGDADRLSTLAASQHLQGDLVGAEALYREVVAARERSLDANELAVADACSALGGLLKDSGEYDEAELWYARARRIRRSHLQPGHPDLAVSAYDLGHVLQARGDYGGAVEWYDEALALWKPSDDDADGRRAWLLSNRGVCLMHLGKMKEAGRALREAHARLVRVLGPTHPRVATSLARQADWLERDGRPEEADRLREGLRSSPR